MCVCVCVLLKHIHVSGLITRVNACVYRHIFCVQFFFPRIFVYRSFFSVRFFFFPTPTLTHTHFARAHAYMHRFLSEWVTFRDGSIALPVPLTGHFPYLCPHTTIYVSAYHYICPHTTVYVSAYLYICPHTTIYVSTYYYIRDRSTAEPVPLTGMCTCLPHT